MSFAEKNACEKLQGGFRKKQRLVAFMISGWPMLKTNGWPLILEYVEANTFNTSGAHNKFPKSGRRPKAAGPFGEGRPEEAPIMCSASIKSIGLRIV